MSTYKCSKCDYIRNNKGLVKKHIENVIKCNGAELIENIVKVKCEVCNKEFDTECLLNIHRKKCIEKKAIVITNYADPSVIEEMVSKMMTVISRISKENQEILKTNEDLMRRIEKLEHVKPKSNNEKIEITDDDLMDGEVLCSTSKTISFVPSSYKQVKEKFESKGQLQYLKDAEYRVDMTLKGSRNDIVEGTVERNCIRLGEDEYYYAKTRGKKSCEDIKIKIVERCPNEAVYMYKGCKFCDECINDD